MSETEQDLRPAEFLHDRDPNLQKSLGVTAVVDYLNQNGAKIPNSPAERIEAYTTFLKEEVGDGILTGDQESIDRQIDAETVDVADVPESYYEFQRRIFREQGYGDVELTDEVKQEMANLAKQDQKARLGEWSSYLTSEDAEYPDWFKLYVWGSLIKLKPYDLETGKIGRRSKGTMATFPELNPEALAIVLDGLLAAHFDGKEVEDKELLKLAEGGNFAKLYAHALKEVSPRSMEGMSTEGSWVTYKKSEGPDEAERLSGSLVGHGTGWCTAGKAVAASQLRGGDFHVFYTKDSKGEETIPRIAVRMANGKIAEVRGVLPGQALEPELIDTALERVKELPGGDEYELKAEDMRRLTELDNRLHKKPDEELSLEDLSFLYELDRDIMGFGYGPDPRVRQLLMNREIKSDLLRLEMPIMGERLAKKLATRRLGYKIWTALEAVDEQTQEILQAIARSREPFESLLAKIDITQTVDKMDILDEVIKGGDFFTFNFAFFVEKFGLDSLTVATKIIENHGRIDQVIAEFDNDPTLDRRSLILMIAREGLIYRLTEDSFGKSTGFIENMSPEDRRDLAKTMVETGDERDLVKFLELFPEVDRQELARHLIDSGKAYYIGFNLKKFPDVDRQEVADSIIKIKIDDYSPFMFVSLLKELPELGVLRVAEKLMELGEYQTIIDEGEVFADLDPAILIDHMLKNGSGDAANQLVRISYIVKNNPQLLKKFHFALNYDLAERLVDSGQFEFVREHQSEFGLSRDEIFELEMPTLPKRSRIARRVVKKLAGV